MLDLCANKIQDPGFISLIKSTTYPKLFDLRLDTNQIEEAGAQALTFGCSLDKLTSISVRGNTFKTKGCQYVQIYAFRNLI